MLKNKGEINMDEKEVIELILITALKLTQDEEKLVTLLTDTGISLNEDLSLHSIDGLPTEVLKKLMVNLTQLPVVKISAKQIIRKSGLTTPNSLGKSFIV